jgi:GNAT superfamily N-acetyltransferase
MPLPFTQDELLREVLIAPREAILPQPDTRILSEDGLWRVITPSLPQGGLNEVCGTRLSEAEADRVIDQTVADYARHGIRFRWTLTPWDSPGDLAERLARRGLTREEACAMYRVLPDGPLATPAGVARVDAANLGDYSRVFAEGFGVDPGPLEPMHRRTLLGEGRGRYLGFLASHQGVPGGGAAVLLLPRSAYLVGSAVSPALRGKGLYKALVQARERAAQEAGLRLVTSLARADSSAPILERLGYATAARVAIFRR